MTTPAELKVRRHGRGWRSADCPVCGLQVTVFSNGRAQRHKVVTGGDWCDGSGAYISPDEYFSHNRDIRQLGEVVGALREIADGECCHIDVDCGCRQVAREALEMIGERGREVGGGGVEAAP